jgi:hypothetical protein
MRSTVTVGRVPVIEYHPESHVGRPPRSPGDGGDVVVPTRKGWAPVPLFRFRCWRCDYWRYTKDGHCVHCGAAP